jgi:twitching motility protein PilT
MESLAQTRVEEMLHLARRRNASDVHLHAGGAPVLRVDGALYPMRAAVADEPEMTAICALLLSNSAREQLACTGDATSIYANDRYGRLRVHAFRSAAGTALAIRLLARSIPAIESLNLPTAVTGLSALSRGLVLVAGPTGSGKTTALAAIVDRINQERAKHILPIEDPIEYR